MEARQPISAAVNFKVDKSSYQRTIVVFLLTNWTCRAQLTEMTGLAVLKTDQITPLNYKEPESAHLGKSEDDEDISEDEAHPEPVQILKEEAIFDSITVWGHDRLPAADDTFAKGIEEWIGFAEAVCTRPHLPPTSPT
jgi:Ribonuclease H2 non-catalytic subunit (Ylr154p-like)